MATIRAYGNSSIPITTWAGGVEYSVGDFVTPTTPNDRIYECVAGGISKTVGDPPTPVEPTWNIVMGSIVSDGQVRWLCLNTFTLNPLTVVLDSGGIGGSSLKDIWVKIPEVVEDTDFTVYGSHSGIDGSWRQIDELTVPHGQRDNRHKGLQNAYRFIKVVAADSVDAEIEIVAGE